MAVGTYPTAVNVNTGALIYGGGEVPDSLLPLTMPDDHGYLAWTNDPACNVNQVTLAAGVLYGSRVELRSTSSVSNVVVFCSTAGSTLTANQNFAGLYDSTGARVGLSAAQTTAWGSTGVKTAALTGGPFTVSAGYYWVVLLSNGSTPPRFGVGSTFSVGVNAGMAASATRFASQATGQTSLPSSITPASWLQDANAPWAAVS